MTLTMGATLGEMDTMVEPSILSGTETMMDIMVEASIRLETETGIDIRVEASRETVMDIFNNKKSYFSPNGILIDFINLRVQL